KQYYGRMLIHSSKLLLAVLGKKLFLHPDLYTVDSGVPVELLAQLYSEPIEKFKDQELIPAPVEAVLKPEVPIDIEELSEQADINPDQLLDLDALIDEQDESLGLDLESF
ncbi:MAG: hypothetical protein OXU45_08055, partial [Candidatus Melainabacteria bacterium]|nr:hypothetical protein [Candidatus Melainabacteria bacterium]